jgi:hypothetical protein
MRLLFVPPQFQFDCTTVQSYGENSLEIFSGFFSYTSTRFVKHSYCLHRLHLAKGWMRHIYIVVEANAVSSEVLTLDSLFEIDLPCSFRAIQGTFR